MSDIDLGESPGTTDTSDSTPTPPPPPPTQDGKVFTQSQIDSIVGRAENKAAKEARASVLDELGMDITEAKRALEEAKAQAEARLTNEQRLERKLAEAEAERARVEKEASDALSQARITAALAQHMDMAAIRRIAPTIHVDPDATDEDLQQIVEDLRLEVPGLFTAPAAGSPTPPGTTSQNRQRPAARQTGLSQAETDKAWVDQWVEGSSGGSELPLL